MAHTDAFRIIFHGSDPDEVLSACEAYLRLEPAELDQMVGDAVECERSAIRRYVVFSRNLIHRLLVGAHESQPDAVVESAEGLAVTDFEQMPAAFAERLLELATLEAPFSPWVNAYGPGRGSALCLVSRIRSLVAGASPLLLPEREAVLPHWPALDTERFSLFIRLASDLLTAWSTSVPQLERVKRAFELSNSELGRLFGSSRQAATAWLEKGVPRARLAKLGTVLNITELLERKLKPGRLPTIARKASEAYGGRTMLEMVAEDRHEELLEDLRATFDWAATA